MITDKPSPPKAAPTQATDCKACRGNVAPGRYCYACGLRGPAGEGKLMCPKCLRFGPHECTEKQ